MNTLLKKHAQNLKENKKGFTLVELIIVLVIIAILAAIAIPSMLHYINQANERVILADARSAYTAAQAVAAEAVAQGNTITVDGVKKGDATVADADKWTAKIAPYLDNKAATDFTVVVVVDDSNIQNFTYVDTDSGKQVKFGDGVNQPVVEDVTSSPQS